MQHQDKLKEQPLSVRIVSERPLTINQIIGMLHQHLTPEQKNELSALLRAKVKKKDIAKYLSKHRTTIWRELRRNSSENGKYHARKAKRLARERRLKEKGSGPFSFKFQRKTKKRDLTPFPHLYDPRPRLR